MTPYKLLAIAPSSDDAQIKTAYLNKIKEYPPDHHPQMFERVQQAYQQIKDITARIKYRLLTPPQFDVAELMLHKLPTKNQARPKMAQLLQLLENSTQK